MKDNDLTKFHIERDGQRLIANDPNDWVWQKLVSVRKPCYVETICESHDGPSGGSYGRYILGSVFSISAGLDDEFRGGLR